MSKGKRLRSRVRREVVPLEERRLREQQAHASVTVRHSDQPVGVPAYGKRSRRLAKQYGRVRKARS